MTCSRAAVCVTLGSTSWSITCNTVTLDIPVCLPLKTVVLSTLTEALLHAHLSRRHNANDITIGADDPLSSLYPTVPIDASTR